MMRFMLDRWMLVAGQVDVPSGIESSSFDWLVWMTDGMKMMMIEGEEDDI